MSQLWPTFICLVIFAGLAKQADSELESAQIRVYANAQYEFGVEGNVVIAMAKEPKISIVLRLSTATYMLAYCVVTSEMPPLFQQTPNLPGVLQQLGIESSEPVEYDNAWYAEVKATFWDATDTKLNLLATVPSMASVSPVQRTVSIQINTRTECVPQLKLLRCADPNEPQLVVISHPTAFYAFFAKSCGQPKNVQVRWQAMDLMETKILKDYDYQQLTLFLPPYGVKFPTDYELWRNRYVFVMEGDYMGKIFKARCYINVVGCTVEAKIAGGLERKVSKSHVLYMDGSQSRDHSKKKFEKQFATYEWMCESTDDNYNAVCTSKQSTENRFVIPADSFSIGCDYRFSLRVVADDNPGAVSRAVQTVHIIKSIILQVAIICYKNCANDMYNPVMKVKLSSVCYNCNGTERSFHWYMSNTLILTARSLKMHLTTDKTIAEIKLVIKDKQGHSGSAVMPLMKNIAPIRGNCSVTPTSGIEAHTRFKVCCTGFVSVNKPIEYFYYAGRVLITKCYTCNCASNLPLNVDHIRVLICGRLMSCRETIVPVKVSALPNIATDTPENLSNFIKTPPNDIEAMRSGGLPGQYMQTIQSLANRINNFESAAVLTNAIDDFKPSSIIMLGRFANLTQTLALKLSPIDAMEQELLIKSVIQVNEIFGRIYSNNYYQLLYEQPFINVTVACVTVYDIMDRLNKNLPRPPQKIYDNFKRAQQKNELNQTFIEALGQQIYGFGDEEARTRSMLWLNSVWSTEILYRYLGYARKYGLQPDNSDVISEGVSLEIQCIQIEKDVSVEISTSDSMHFVYFSPELLQELKESDNDHICLKVVSTRRELNWWYPEEKQPSTVLLSVRIYYPTDNFESEIKLHNSDISFKTKIGIYKPASEIVISSALENVQVPRLGSPRQDFQPIIFDEEDELTAVADSGKYVNCLEDVTINSYQRVRMYRINLDERAMLAIIFTKSTHKLRVLPFMGTPPRDLRKALEDSTCSVPVGSKRTVILLRNKCSDMVQSAHIAIQVFDGPDYKHIRHTPIADGPALLSFVFQVRSCDYWKYSQSPDKQHWSHDDCIPQLDYTKKGYMHCTCKVLGTYTSYIFHVPAIQVPLAEFSYAETSWLLVAAYIVILLLLLIWLAILYIFCNKQNSKTVRCDMKGLEKASVRNVRDLLVVIKTGGRLNALTTASVRLIFQTTMRTELQFTLMQDPERPHLTRNSTYILWLRTRDIRIPTRVAVAHNNAGRYPTWFLRRIEVIDIHAQLTQIFIVRRWVRQKFLILSSSMVFRPSDEQNVESWRGRFATELEHQWINWGLLQPLFGKWRDIKPYDTFTRFQRCCMFACKILITFCICACCLGHTTAETLFVRRKYDYNYYTMFKMFILSCIFTNLAHFIFVFVLVRFAKK